MAHRDLPVAALERLGQVLRHGDGAVAPAGAPERDGEVGPAVPLEGRQQGAKHRDHALEEGAVGRVVPHMAGDFRRAPGEGPERRHVVGICEKADVEHEISLRGHTMAVGEGEHEDHRRVRGLWLKARRDDTAQIADGEPTGVECEVGPLAEPAEQRALAPNSFLDRLVVSRGCGRRVSLKRRRSTAVSQSRKSQGDVARPLGAEQRPEITFDGVEPLVRESIPRASAPCRLPSSRSRTRIRKQREREVVDRLVAEVFQDLECGRLAGAGHSRHQNKGAIAGAIGQPSSGRTRRLRALLDGGERKPHLLPASTSRTEQAPRAAPDGQQE